MEHLQPWTILFKLYSALTLRSQVIQLKTCSQASMFLCNLPLSLRFGFLLRLVHVCYLLRKCVLNFLCFYLNHIAFSISPLDTVTVSIIFTFFFLLSWSICYNRSDSQAADIEDFGCMRTFNTSSYSASGRVYGGEKEKIPWCNSNI